MTKKSKKKGKYGICRECKTREGDSSEKRLYKCKYCGEYFCKKHLEPRMVIIKNDIEKVKDPVLRDKLYEEWRKTGGHPDWKWTQKRWEELTNEDKNYTQALETLLNKPKKDDKSLEVRDTRVTRIDRGGAQSKLSEFKRYLYRFQYYTLPVLLRYFLVILLILSLLHYLFLEKLDFIAILERALILSILIYVSRLIYHKTKYYIPYKLLIIVLIIIFVLYLSSGENYSKLSFVDHFVGIDNFTITIVNFFNSSIQSKTFSEISHVSLEELAKNKDKYIGKRIITEGLVMYYGPLDKRLVLTDKQLRYVFFISAFPSKTNPAITIDPACAPGSVPYYRVDAHLNEDGSLSINSKELLECYPVVREVLKEVY